MCTAITYQTKDHYFGRNLDLEYSYHETVTITPRHYCLNFRNGQTFDEHLAIMGMAYVVNDYPLYYDAMNEKGVVMAGLNFPGNACYLKENQPGDNIAPFELIPWILSQCQNITEVKKLLKTIHIVDISFSDQLPNSPLHWIIADKEKVITVECVKEGLKIYDNPVGVLTNNPAFDIHMFTLNQYMHLSASQPVNHFSKTVPFQYYCQGMGAIGLPGDMSSLSRFVRATFTKLNAISADDENSSVHQFFHILNSVAFTKGTVCIKDDVYDMTVYSSCCNLDKKIYYYTTYENSHIVGVDMNNEDLDRTCLKSYDLIKEALFIQNKN